MVRMITIIHLLEAPNPKVGRRPRRVRQGRRQLTSPSSPRASPINFAEFAEGFANHVDLYSSSTSPSSPRASPINFAEGFAN